MRRALIPLTLFSLAFGYEEATVVLYLRRIAFPPGPAHVFALESGREASTIIVLAVLAWLCGRQGIGRWRAFLVAFGLWDVFYYAWLYVLSGSPTFTSTDVLFLLPVPWVAPVWSAITFALILVAAGFFGLHRRRVAFFGAGLLFGFISFVARGIGIAHGYPVLLFIVAAALAVFAINVADVARNVPPEQPGRILGEIPR